MPFSLRSGLNIAKLNYLLYTPTIGPEVIRNTTSSQFVPPSAELRQILQNQSETIHGAAPVGMGLPEELQGYHTLVPLEATGPGVERRKLGNWHSTVYRAIRGSDGVPHALRRVESELGCFCI
jgi:PAB-dependent poly(A)-specific ribonuclease subunit 3